MPLYMFDLFLFFAHVLVQSSSLSFLYHIHLIIVSIEESNNCTRFDLFSSFYKFRIPSYIFLYACWGSILIPVIQYKVLIWFEFINCKSILPSLFWFILVLNMTCNSKPHAKNEFGNCHCGRLDQKSLRVYISRFN